MTAADHAGCAGSRILGIGTYRPSRSVSNETVCGPIRSSDEWIRRRCGIISRHFADPGETVVAMATAAGSKAIASSGIAPERVDTVLLASMSYLHQSPAAAPQVAEQLRTRAAAALDVHAACAGFCYSLGVADSLVRAGASRHVLVIGSEKMTDIIDPHDRSTAFLFGDGAGAVVVGPADYAGIGPVAWGSDGSGAGLIAHSDSWLATREPGAGWPTMRMSGPEVYRWVLREITPVAHRAVAAAGLTVGDLAAFVPHQANLRITEAIARALHLPPEVVVARSIVHDGNTSAASIPLALDELMCAGEVSPGDRALLIGFGSGLAYAGQVVVLP